MNTPSLFGLALFVSTLGAPSAAAAPQEAAREAARAELPDLARRAVRSIHEADYDGARGLLGELVVQEHLDDARALFAQSLPEDGLLAVDRALAIAPNDLDAKLLRAEGSLMLAENLVATGGASPLFVEGAFSDALAAFQEIPPRGDQGVDPRVLFGASRAAYMLQRGSEALDYARNGMQVLAGGPEEAGLSVLPERTWAEASFLVYREAKTAEEETASELFAETETALQNLLGRTPSDPWVWTNLARLYQWEGRTEEAATALQRGLDRVPGDAALISTLVDVASADGNAAVIDQLDRLVERHPDDPNGYWFRGVERFDHATDQLIAGEFLPTDFQQAEEDFARCRELEPEYTRASQGYEVMCRDGVAWCLYQEDDLDAAVAAFESMEEVFEGGMTWSIESRLLSGVDGLEFVAAAYNEQEDWGSAAEVFAKLADYQPDEVKWANNAGFFHRDAGVPLELTAVSLCATESLDELPDYMAELVTEKFDGDLAAAANKYNELAREHIEASYENYLEAVALAPDDVRVLNDAALIAVHYLQTNFDHAEELLLEAARLGEVQLAAMEPDDEARWELENAWGDAYENLGVLYLGHKNDPETARGYFEKSVEIGPEPRRLLTEVYIPLCDATPEEIEAATKETPFLGIRPWGQPCE